MDINAYKNRRYKKALNILSNIARVLLISFCIGCVVLLGIVVYYMHKNVEQQQKESIEYRKEVDERIRQYNLKHGTSTNSKNQDSLIQGR